MSDGRCSFHNVLDCIPSWVTYEIASFLQSSPILYTIVPNVSKCDPFYNFLQTRHRANSLHGFFICRFVDPWNRKQPSTPPHLKCFKLPLSSLHHKKITSSNVHITNLLMQRSQALQSTRCTSSCFYCLQLFNILKYSLISCSFALKIEKYKKL